MINSDSSNSKMPIAPMLDPAWIFRNQCDNPGLWLERLRYRRPIELIIPLYNITPQMIKLLDNKWLKYVFARVIIIDDKGDLDNCVQFTAMLKKSLGDFLVLYANRRNLGFVRSVNIGLKIADVSSDIIILNSDGMLTPLTVGRLIISAHSFTNIATISPLSNNNGYFSLDIKSPMQLDAIDKINEYLSLLPIPFHEAVPANNGFCLYVKAEALQTLGLLDERLYHRGYAEETDFCIRARESGMVNLCCWNSYAYHQGGVSFGSDKINLKKINSRILQSCYPGFLDELRIYEDTSALHPIKEIFNANADMFNAESSAEALMHNLMFQLGCVLEMGGMHRDDSGLNLNIDHLVTLTALKIWPTKLDSSLLLANSNHKDLVSRVTGKLEQALG